MATVTVAVPNAVLTGLANGTTYDITVTARNSAGSSAAVSGQGTPAQTVLVPPAAPTGVTLTPGVSGSLVASWTASTAHVDYPVTAYTATLTGPTPTQTVNVTNLSALTATFTGLQNGGAYSVSVVANSSAGSSPAGTATSTPATAPGLVTGLVATPSSGSVALSWTAPASTGGSAITSYSVTATAVGETNRTASPTTTTTTFTGLTNGVIYTFLVAAVNAVGTGPTAQTTSTPAVAAATPGAPTALVVTPASTQLTLTWTAPSNNGGSTITGYEITLTPPGGTPISTTSTTTTKVVTGLTNGTLYSITVAAVNAAGTGLPLNGSGAPTLATAPTAPLDLVLTSSNAGAAVSWSPPTSDGGSVITRYNLSITGAGSTQTTTTTGLSTSFTGLANGSEYTVSVTATNVNGTGPAVTGTVIPQAPLLLPSAPTGVSATPGNLSVTVSWVAPNAGSSQINSYNVDAVPQAGGATVSAVVDSATFSTVLNGLTNDALYTVMVSATSNVGTGPATSTTVTPRAPVGSVPSAPTGLTVTPGNRQLVASWGLPLNNGGWAVQGYRVVVSGIGYSTTTTSTTGTTIVIPNLTNGVTYTVAVSAANLIGNGLEATRTAAPISSTTTPGPVLNANRVALSTSSVRITWTAPIVGGEPSSYSITSVPARGIPVVLAPNTSCTVTGLATDTLYTFTITPVNQYGSGTATTLAEVRTLSVDAPPPLVLPEPVIYAFPQPTLFDPPRIFRPANFGKTIDEVPVGE